MRHHVDLADAGRRVLPVVELSLAHQFAIMDDTDEQTGKH
jgi:hypothetical protein